MGRECVMRRLRAFTLIELIVMVVIVVMLAGAFGLAVRARARAERTAGRAYCMNNVRQIGLAMIQYAGDNDDAFMPLVDAAGNKVPAVDNAGVVSSLPARTGFVVLLNEGYLTTTKVFISRGCGDQVNDAFPSDYKNATLAQLAAALGENNCSYGWDPTKKHSADATCAIIADKPSPNVSAAGEGTTRNNSDNHGGYLQCVMYNDGHVKFAWTPRPDAGDDPDIYTGGPGYERSNTDAKIIR